MHKSGWLHCVALGGCLAAFLTVATPSLSQEDTDLKAQQSIAQSTAEMVRLTERQLLVGGAGVLLLLITVGLTLRATNAAVTANTIARETAQQELRAYVNIDIAVLELPMSGKSYFSVQTNIKNFGQTPAYQMVYRIGRKLAPPTETDFPIDALKPSASHTLPPAQVFGNEKPVDGMDEERFLEYQKEEKAVFICGRIDYVDAFGANHFTTFRMVHQFGIIKNFSFCQEGNDSN